MCNDWVETFCEYNIDDQLNGSIFHLSEMDEECLGIFSVSIFIVMMIMYKLCNSCFLLTIQMKSIQIKSNNESDDHIS